tara:strand:- start:583 stop:939 length:357 start_codon:yes stop_codon:yes gene_type:complete
MGRYAVIEDGVVINVVESGATYAKAKGWVASDTADIDDTYDGTNFTKPPVALDTDAGRSMVALRLKRNYLLSTTDWWGASDLTMTQAQKDYRQSLRDLPANQTPENTALTNINWPTEP